MSGNQDTRSAAQGRGEIHSPGDGNHTPQQSNERSAACPYCGGTSGFSFDRSLCACDSMHDYCEDCGHALNCPLDDPDPLLSEASEAESLPDNQEGRAEGQASAPRSPGTSEVGPMPDTQEGIREGRGTPTRTEGWFGALVIHFAPDVTRDEANDLMAALCRSLRDQDSVPVLSADFEGPAS